MFLRSSAYQTTPLLIEVEVETLSVGVTTLISSASWIVSMPA